MDNARRQIFDAGSADRRFALRLSFFYAAVFWVAGIKTTYFPVWLDSRGFSASEIGLIASTPMVLRIVAAPAIAWVTDAFGNHRRVMIGLAWSALAMTSLLLATYGFLQTLVIVILLSLASNSLVPHAEALAMAGVKRAGHDYGRMRLWGSLTFVLAGFAAGLGIDRHGPEATVWLLLSGGFITALAAHTLPAPAITSGLAHENLRASAIVGARDSWRMLTDREFLVVLLAAASVQSAHAMFYIFGVLIWLKQGYGSITASALWMIGIVTEVALLAFSTRAVATVGAAGLVLAGAVASVLRWATMASDPGLPLLVMLQALHGLTYGATHIGAVHLLATIVPAGRASTAQGIYASVTSGIGMGLATLLAGSLYPLFGSGAYFGMAAIAMIGVIAGLFMVRRFGRRRGRGPDARA